MAIPLKKKEEIIGGINARLEGEAAVLVVDYMGLTVNEIQNLRRKLRTDGVSMMVAKNTLMRRALTDHVPEGADRDQLFSLLAGPSALVFAPGDPIAASRHLAEFAKGNDRLKIKGGYYAGKYLDAQTVDMFSKLGSKEQIIGKLIMSLRGPLYKLVNVLNGPMTKLAGTLKAVSEKG